jgi:hypothetical protein
MSEKIYEYRINMPDADSYIMCKSFNHPKTWSAGQKVEKAELEKMWGELYGAQNELNVIPPTRRREAIEHTRRKLGL